MISKVKKNYKFILGIIVGAIVSGIVVYAVTIDSSNISYDNKASGLSSTTLKGAIDELYEKMPQKTCKVVEGNKSTIGSEVNCGGENFYISTTGSTITLIAKYGLNSSYQQSTTPTPANYSNATQYIENYAKNTLSGIKGDMSFYGHTTYSEVKKLSSTVSEGALVGDKVGLSGAYWTSESAVIAYMGSVYAESSASSTDASVKTSVGTFNIYARPMIKVTSSTINS